MVSLKIKGSLIVISIFVLFMILNVGLAFGTVQESEAAVELNWGEYTGVTHQSGSHLLGTNSGIPLVPNGFAYSTARINVEPITMTQSSSGLSEDGQDINAKVSVTYRVESDQAGAFYSDSETSAPFRSTEVWEERVGQRAVQSAIQDGASSVSLLELVEDFDKEDGATIEVLRQELQKEVNTQLREETEEVSPEVSILAVRVEEVSLSKELDDGLENIAVERANAEKKLIQAEGDAEARRARADGQADAFNTRVEAYGSTEAALQADWIEAIRQDDGTIVLDGEAAPLLELTQEQNATNSTNTNNDGN